MNSLKNNGDYAQKYDTYLEKLLLAQFDVCEIFEHNLTKGEAREDFLKDMIRNQFKQICVMKGIIIENDRQSGQCDGIFTKRTARLRSFGSHNMVEIKDCEMILEIKSRAKGEDLKSFNKKAEEIKNLISEGFSTDKPLCGMFCYQIELKEETIFKRFGFDYNQDLLTFEFSNDFEKWYPNIDFLVSLHDCFNPDKECNETKQFFLRWDENNQKYLLFRDYPVSKHFFSLINSINSKGD